MNNKELVKKGQSVLISHAMMIGVSIVLVLIVSTTLNNLRLDYQEFIGSHELEQGCFVIQDAVQRVYSRSSYVSPTTTAYGSLRVVMPSRIADLKYRAYFENRTLFIENFGGHAMNTSCKIGFNASYSGSTSGGITEVSYREYSNGTRKIHLEQVG